MTRFNREDEKHGGVSILTEDFVEVGITAGTLTSVITAGANERLILTKATCFLPSSISSSSAEVQDGNGAIIARKTGLASGDTFNLYDAPDGLAVPGGEIQVVSNNSNVEFTVAGRVQQTFTV